MLGECSTLVVLVQNTSAQTFPAQRFRVDRASGTPKAAAPKEEPPVSGSPQYLCSRMKARERRRDYRPLLTTTFSTRTSCGTAEPHAVAARETGRHGHGRARPDR